jgi:hypothetical protein
MAAGVARAAGQAHGRKQVPGSFLGGAGTGSGAAKANSAAPRIGASAAGSPWREAVARWRQHALRMLGQVLHDALHSSHVHWEALIKLPALPQRARERAAVHCSGQGRR